MQQMFSNKVLCLAPDLALFTIQSTIARKASLSVQKGDSVSFARRVARLVTVSKTATALHLYPLKLEPFPSA